MKFKWRIVDLCCDAAGQLDPITQVNGVTTTYTHDLFSRVTSETVTASGGMLLATLREQLQ